MQCNADLLKIMLYFYTELTHREMHLEGIEILVEFRALVNESHFLSLYK